jgi:biofilm PGA synthesis N-glycosyltransferase PgaC
MDDTSYVLVTPARNEAATIEETIKSVISQTVLPLEWIIVSDGSTDRMNEIVLDYSSTHPFIRLLSLGSRPSRNFASVVFATESGVNALTIKSYSFIGLLDADVRFRADYFERLIERFRSSPRLGLAGGLVLDINDKSTPGRYLGDVAGAVQFFTKDCFDSIGGLVAIPEGGWDAITNVQARANGYSTQTFSDLVVDHLKPRNIAEGGPIRRKWQLGIRDYALGYHPIFEFAKCIDRWTEGPLLVSALARWSGFCWATISRRPHTLTRSMIAKVRQEQIRRMLACGRNLRK